MEYRVRRAVDSDAQAACEAVRQSITTLCVDDHREDEETLAAWLTEEPPLLPLKDGKPDPRSLWPSTLRLRLRQMPSVPEKGLWPAQLRAIRNLEASFYDDRPRALIQMATGSGNVIC